MNLETIEESVERKTLKMFQKSNSHPNPAVRTMLQPNRKTIKREGINALKRRAEEHGTQIKRKRPRN